MTRTSSSSDATEVVPAAKEEMPILANLFELYAHDFSEFHQVELGPDGRFGYSDLALYWSEPGRFPFLIKVAGKIAGFALVKKAAQTAEQDEAWDMAEFFVLRGYRGRGVGWQAAHHIWRRFEGHWQVRVLRANEKAFQFWQSAVASFTGARVSMAEREKAGELWDVFSFASAI